jgi:hypothetical protein
MRSIRSILDEFRGMPDCEVSSPNGLPLLPDGLVLPADLREFYELTGGAVLFSKRVCPGRIRIVGPDEVRRIDLAIMGEQFATGPFEWWFAIADVMDGNYVAIDLKPEHAG